jgi:hypothetical protein
MDGAWLALQGHIGGQGPGGGGDAGVAAAGTKGWVIAAAAGGVAAIGVGALLLANAGPEDPVTPSRRPEATVVAEPTTSPPQPEQPAEADTATLDPSARPARAPGRAAGSRSRPGAHEKPRAPRPEPEADLAQELALIASAKALLASGDARAALAKTAEHARRFPHGSLVDERRLLRMQALCEDGREELARKEAAAFLRRKPNAAISTRVREACP